MSKLILNRFSLLVRLYSGLHRISRAVSGRVHNLFSNRLVFADVQLMNAPLP